jgi:hypothetical protein
MAAQENPLEDAINKEVRHGSSTTNNGDAAAAPTFTLEAQRKYNAFNAGIVKRSALEFVKEGPTYFRPKSPEKPGIAGVPFFTSFKPQSAWELQKARARAAVDQMGDYKPPSHFDFRQAAADAAPAFKHLHVTPAAAVLERELGELRGQLKGNLTSTQKHALRQRIAKKQAALAKERADFSCAFGTESLQTLKKKIAVNQEGLFDEESLEPGDTVLVHFPGTSECWRGPFVVVRRINASLFTLRSDEYGEMDAETSRLQDMRIKAKPPSKNVTDKHFVRNVGRSTAKDAVIELAKANNAARDPYAPPSAYEFVQYDTEEVAAKKRLGQTQGESPGGRSSSAPGSGSMKRQQQQPAQHLEPQPAEEEAEERRRRFTETQRKATTV